MDINFADIKTNMKVLSNLFWVFNVVQDSNSIFWGFMNIFDEDN